MASGFSVLGFLILGPRRSGRHAIVGLVAQSVLAMYIYELMKGEMPPEVDPDSEYFKSLEKLTAAGWRAGL